jgi:hypothetical protein
VTHPFHPLCEQEFEFVARRNSWGEDRVCFHDERGELKSLPAAWTDVVEPDPWFTGQIRTVPHVSERRGAMTTPRREPVLIRLPCGRR